NVLDLNRMAPAHLSGHAWHRIWMTGTIERGPGIIDINPIKRGRKAVGVAFAPHLAVCDYVEPGALLVAYREQRCVVLRLFQKFGRDAPEFLGADARRKPGGELGAVNQPVGLRIGADERGWEEFSCHKPAS